MAIYFLYIGNRGDEWHEYTRHNFYSETLAAAQEIAAGPIAEGKLVRIERFGFTPGPTKIWWHDTDVWVEAA